MYIFQSNDYISITNSTMSHNIGCIDGGGMYLYQSNDFASVTNSTISYNTDNVGGGIYIIQSNDYMSITNSTMSNNIGYMSLCTYRPHHEHQY
jgi:hypothetical protein